MKLWHDKSLKPYNTFGIDVWAKKFFCVDKAFELSEIMQSILAEGRDFFILGGGSNVLFTRDLDVVLKLCFTDFKVIVSDEDKCLIEADAGLKWDDLVYWTVENDLYGLVNLSFIPGTVGAAPVQNIGAYGTEIKDVLKYVEVFDIEQNSFKRLSAQECEFGYRTSIFKTRLRNHVIITRIGLELSKKPQFNLSYGPLKELASVANLSQRLVRLKLGQIRMKKLPDPSIIGNAGSFFKNPVVSEQKYIQLKKRFPSMPAYEMDSGWKIPAGWLIDNLGLKGYRMGQAAVYEHNALVLVNLGKATAADILNLAKFIQQKVWQAYAINLEFEVNVI